MTDVVFTREELECLLDYAEGQHPKTPWAVPQWSPAQWVALQNKLAEACRQAHAIQAGHDAYIARLNAADHEYRRY